MVAASKPTNKSASKAGAPIMQLGKKRTSKLPNILKSKCVEGDLTSGSFFSGMENGLRPLQYVLQTLFGPNVHVKQKFAIDKDRACQRFLKANIASDCVIYGDVKNVNLARLPYVDFLWYSPPCNKYSQQGKQQGWEASSDHRDGTLVNFPLEYIRRHQPLVAVMEQVPTIKTKHFGVYSYIMHSLRRIGNCCYSVTDHVVDTKDYGVPQRRKRLYIVALHKSAVPSIPVFQMPAPLPVPSLESDFDMQLKGCLDDVPDYSIPNLFEAMKKVFKKGGNPCTETWIMDILGGGKNWVTVEKNLCPTITANRGYGGGYFISNLMRFTTHEELAKLQGVNMQGVVIPDTVSIKQFKKMVGNAVSSNVSGIIFFQILNAMK
ncbi:unnamed protein product [Prorocentrum cordatum]|uniref:DNA (cytosine-5-)-methyltransferase n=1 Tax=Prorocentrum cordatum TaxID=2364126 RepID=A0ABN9U6F8_9DINO|nr:unnamed protein product [Polarella glacialis]